ncbi:hypothetical protein CC78DRAFT_583130 [Lojkania enalia]|uniref:Uncharacterized protein n=1 Tax=Lojkania enalia TaxID=147567 RepID=A0A9P4K9G8_9PLEO|nr:hypothetical protein CC78DRAFT_583130 [Didymosphaeria enalia]
MLRLFSANIWAKSEQCTASRASQDARRPLRLAKVLNRKFHQQLPDLLATRKPTQVVLGAFGTLNTVTLDPQAPDAKPKDNSEKSPSSMLAATQGAFVEISTGTTNVLTSKLRLNNASKAIGPSTPKSAIAPMSWDAGVAPSAPHSTYALQVTFSVESAELDNDTAADEANLENGTEDASSSNSGLAAGLLVMAAHFTFINTWDLAQIYGAFQAFYKAHLMKVETLPAVSRIGSP